LHNSQQDQFGRLLPTFIQVINFTEKEESEYWAVVSAVFEGRQVDRITSHSKFDLVASTSAEAGINNKVLSYTHCENGNCFCLLSFVFFPCQNHHSHSNNINAIIFFISCYVDFQSLHFKIDSSCPLNWLHIKMLLI